MILKKAAIIFSFLLITAFSVGSFFLHQLYLKSYKKEFKTYISKYKEQAAFSTITICPSELYTNSANITWEDENKEVVYKNILYDVVSITGKGLTIELTVVSDHQEMALKKQFAVLYDVNSNKKTKGPFDLLKQFLALKYIVHSANLDLNNVVTARSDSFTSSAFLIITRVIARYAPPPDFTL